MRCKTCAFFQRTVDGKYKIMSLVFLAFLIFGICVLAGRR